jgi:DNA-binding NarL/FixJ family response regulator
MKILLVEDDENKRRQVVRALREASPQAVVHEARSLTSGLRALESEKWDLVVLDMSIPAFDITRDERGGRPQALGGRDMLRHMRRLAVASPVVVLTQYDEFGEGPRAMSLDQLDHLLHREHGPGYLGAIVYNVVYDEWRATLASTVQGLEEADHD